MRHNVSKVATVPPDPVDVTAFCRVVDLGSVTAAAHELGETKGTVSRRIDRLEALLGVQLLQRSGRGVLPTEAGLLYRERAGAALEQLADASSVVREQGGTPSGHLRVTAPLGLGTTFLGRVTGGFVDQFPDVTVEYVLTDQVLSFDRDRIDVALRLSAQLADSTLLATRLFSLDGIFVASPQYLERRGSPASPDDLDAHTLMVPPLRGVATPLTFVPRDGGPAVEKVVRGRVLSHDLLLLREVALQGAGIAMSLRQSVEADLASGRLVEVLTEWRGNGATSLWLLSRPAPLPPKVRAFRDHVLKVAAEPACKARAGG